MMRGVTSQAAVLGLGMTAMTSQALAGNNHLDLKEAKPAIANSAPLSPNDNRSISVPANFLKSPTSTFFNSPATTKNPLSVTGGQSSWASASLAPLPVLASTPTMTPLAFIKPERTQIDSVLHYGGLLAPATLGAEAIRQTYFPIYPGNVNLVDYPKMGGHKFSKKEPYFPGKNIEIKNTTRLLGMASGGLIAADASNRLISGSSKTQGTETLDSLRIASGGMLTTQAYLFHHPISRPYRPLLALGSLAVGGAELNEVIQNEPASQITSTPQKSKLNSILEIIGFVGLMFSYAFKNSSKGFWNQLKSTLENPLKFWKKSGFQIYDGPAFDVVVTQPGESPQKYAAWNFKSPITAWRGKIDYWKYWFRKEGDPKELARVQQLATDMIDEFHQLSGNKHTSHSNGSYSIYKISDTNPDQTIKIDIPKEVAKTTVMMANGKIATLTIEKCREKLFDGSETIVTKTTVTIPNQDDDGAREISKKEYDHLIILSGNRPQRVGVTDILLPEDEDTNSHTFLSAIEPDKDGNPVEKLYEVLGYATLLKTQNYHLPMFGVGIRKRFQGGGLLREFRKVHLAFTEKPDNPGPSAANYITEVKSRILMGKIAYRSSLFDTGYVITAWINYNRPTMHDLGYHNVNRVMAIVRQRPKGLMGWLGLQAQKVSDTIHAHFELYKSPGAKKGFIERTKMRDEPYPAYMRPDSIHSEDNAKSKEFAEKYRDVPFRDWPLAVD